MSEAGADLGTSNVRGMEGRLLGDVAFGLTAIVVGLAFYGVFRFGEESGVGAWPAVAYAFVALIAGAVIIWVTVSWLHRRLVRQHRDLTRSG